MSLVTAPMTTSVKLAQWVLALVFEIAMLKECPLVPS